MNIKETNIKPQSKEIRVPGFATQSGCLYKISSEDTLYIGREIKLCRVFTDIDTTEVYLELEFDYRGRTVIKELPREDLNRKGLQQLTAYGADCFENVSREYLNYIVGLEKMVPEINTHHRVGWTTYKGTKIFEHYKAIGCYSEYRGELYELEPRGCLEGWKGIITEHVLGYKWLELALAIGFTAPLIGLFWNTTYLDSLFFHIYGLSTQGKTTATRVAVSAWGFPDTSGKGLIKTWNGSDVNILAKCRDNFGIPVGLDDASVRSSSSDLTSLVYQLAAGRDKDRLDQSGKTTNTAEWNTTIISNAEHSLLQNSNQNAGLRVRLIEIGNRQWTESKEHSEAITEGLLRNYGHAGPLFIEYILNLGEEVLYNRWRQWEINVLAAMNKKDNFSGRIATKLATVMLAAELANEALELSLNTEIMVESLLELEHESIEGRNLGDNAFADFEQLYLINKNRFYCSDPSLTQPVYGEHWGKYDIQNGKESMVYVLKKVFHDEMKKMGYTNTNAILKIWKEQGKLIPSSDRTTKDKVVVTGYPEAVVYAIVMPKIISKKYN